MNEPNKDKQPQDEHPHDEIVEQGEPREAHTAAEELAQAEDHHVEVDQDLPPKKRAKQIRKLSDEELVELADEAAKAEHWLDVARRGQAELDNTIKRLRRDQTDAMRYANSSLARDLLQVVDNLQRALKAAADTQEFKALHDGVKLTTQILLEALERHDIRPIECEGQPFDPALHEALLTTSRDDLDHNVVAAELERGWMLHDRVLRAAKVQVNKRGE
jgi:molecular chaperone GrpE